MRQHGRYVRLSQVYGICGVAPHPHPALDTIGESPCPRRAQICAKIDKPTRQRWRSTEVMAVIRWIRREAGIRTSQQLSFVSTIVLPCDRYGAGILGQRAFEERQGAISECAVDRIHATIPGPASEIMVQPFYDRAWKPRKALAHQKFKLESQLVEIVLLIE